jgi:hypothetical protein
MAFPGGVLLQFREGLLPLIFQLPPRPPRQPLQPTLEFIVKLPRLACIPLIAHPCAQFETILLVPRRNTGIAPPDNVPTKHRKGPLPLVGWQPQRPPGQSRSINNTYTSLPAREVG